MVKLFTEPSRPWKHKTSSLPQQSWRVSHAPQARAVSSASRAQTAAAHGARLSRTTAAQPRGATLCAGARRLLPLGAGLACGGGSRQRLRWPRPPASVRMEPGGRRGLASARGPASATRKPRQEPGAGAEARAPGVSAVRARRFLLCLYLVGFLVSSGAEVEGLRPGPGTQLGVVFFLKLERW